MIGQLLAGHYRVLQVLGAGGFGQTYITEDLHLPGNPKCVLKHLKPASANPGLLSIARKLFEKEAIVLQQLGNHDRIPRLLAYFEEQQEFYLVQEYVPGHPLSQELANGTKWREQQVIELLAEILEILIFIHSQGVIHRDIKPDNIMRRDRDQHVVLIDFGAIKQVRNQQMLNGQQTMTVAIGTPGYMPIEQASGTPRASSDLYALGAIGIQALTGVNPYDLDEDERTGEIKWEHLAVANPQLIAILQRMTRYHFKDRYHTAAEALQAVKLLNGGTFPQVSTYVQPTQPTALPTRLHIESQRTVAVLPPAYIPPTTVATPRTPKAPNRSMFPLIAGIISILAAVGSFAWFSGRLFDRRSFATDLKSDLCRVATPTDLSSTRVRSKPQRDATIQTSLPRGTKIVYLTEEDAFVKIQLADNSTGWVYNNQIDHCNKPPTTPKPIPSKSVTIPAPIPVPPAKVRPTPTIPKPSPSNSISPTPTPSTFPSPSIEIIPASPSPTLAPSPTPTPSATPFTSPRGIQQPTPLPSSSPSPSSLPVEPPVEDRNPPVLNKSNLEKETDKIPLY